MLLFIKLAFAGLGPLLLHWGIGVAIIIVCLVIEFAGAWIVASVPLLAKPIAWLQKWVLLVAVIVGCSLGYGTIIARDMAARCAAKSVSIEHVVTKAVTDANGNTSTKDKFETDH